MPYSRYPYLFPPRVATQEIGRKTSSLRKDRAARNQVDFLLDRMRGGFSTCVRGLLSNLDGILLSARPFNSEKTRAVHTESATDNTPVGTNTSSGWASLCRAMVNISRQHAMTFIRSGMEMGRASRSLVRLREGTAGKR